MYRPKRILGAKTRGCLGQNQIRTLLAETNRISDLCPPRCITQIFYTDSVGELRLRGGRPGKSARHGDPLQTLRPVDLSSRPGLLITTLLREPSGIVLEKVEHAYTYRSRCRNPGPCLRETIDAAFEEWILMEGSRLNIYRQIGHAFPRTTACRRWQQVLFASTFWPSISEPLFPQRLRS